MKYSETYSSNEFLPISAQKFDILTFLGPIRVLAPNLDYSCMMYIVHILEICGRICGLHCVSLTEKYFRNLIKSNPKSDCIYHFPIDLEPNRNCPFAVFCAYDVERGEVLGRKYSQVLPRPKTIFRRVDIGLDKITARILSLEA